MTATYYRISYTDDGLETKGYLFLQVLLCDLDGVVLDAVPVPLIRHLLGHKLLQDEQQQLVVVSAESQVPGERLENKRKNWTQ